MRDEARLHAHLDRSPGDLDSRRVLADLLEERGLLIEAAFQRWLVEARLWPDDDLRVFGQTGWHWWSLPDRRSNRDHAVLPDDIQRFMPEGEWLYPTRAEAERVLAEALHEASLKGLRVT